MRSPFRSAFCAVLLLATLSAAQCDSGTPAPKPPPNSWLILLCRASDDDTEPHDVNYYSAVFREAKLRDYFKDISFGKVDISGSQVYGWFRMPTTKAEMAPDVRNAGTDIGRDQTARDCRNAAYAALASKSPVDPENFVGVVTIINVPVDSGQAGDKSVVFHDAEMGNISYLSHEMLHVLGLGHSRRVARDVSADHVWSSAKGVNPQGNQDEYWDCFDIMSYVTCTFTNTLTTTGPDGPELQAVSARQLGWLPEDRVRDVPTSATVQLAPISDPSKPGAMLALVDVAPVSGTYAIEYRERSRHDAGIPRSAVLIREVRGKNTGIVWRQDGRLDWVQGETFTDVDNMIRIHIDEIKPGSARVSVDTFFSPGPLAIGGKCGRADRGQLLACPATTQCAPRRTGQIESIDWYCLP